MFYIALVKPVLILMLGLSVRNYARMPTKGPHIVAANHNSHLDAMVLMSLFRLRDMPKVKLVAAKDYFCRGPISTWFSMNIIGVIPIDRKGGENPTAPVIEAIDQGYIVVMFPEGSRGEPELRQPVKYGIAKVLENRPQVAITPVFMHGLGKSLPRGDAVFVPFVCEVNIGEDIYWQNDRTQLVTRLEDAFTTLEREIAPKAWK